MEELTLIKKVNTYKLCMRFFKEMVREHRGALNSHLGNRVNFKKK